MNYYKWYRQVSFLAERFNEILSRLRREKGVSQRQAAAALGISQALLSHYEKGVREPGLAFIAQACEYYDSSADYLLGLSAYRQKMDFSPDEVADVAPYFSAGIALAHAAFSIKEENIQLRMASLLSALLYSLSDNRSDPLMIDALISLRRAQLSNELSLAGIKVPDVLRELTEKELATLYDK